MINFKNWLLLEGFNNIYESCIMESLVERTCRDVINFLIETENSEDDEKFTGNIEDEKFPDNPNARPVDDKKSGRTDYDRAPDVAEPSPEENSKRIQDLQKQLKNVILILRWNAMNKRAEEIEKVKALRDEYVRDYGNPFESKKVSESTEDDDDDSELVSMMQQSSKKFDVMKAVPLLEKLGYISLNKLHQDGESDEDIKKIVTAALFKAADETGNELPPDIDRETIHSYNVQDAVNKFYFLMRDIFKRSFRKIVRGNTGAVQSGKFARTGYHTFDQGEGGQVIDDIANNFSTHMLAKSIYKTISPP